MIPSILYLSEVTKRPLSSPLVLVSAESFASNLQDSAPTRIQIPLRSIKMNGSLQRPIQTSNYRLGGGRLRNASLRYVCFSVDLFTERMTDPAGAGSVIYRLPLRLASKIITSGPAAKTKRIAANWKMISKFILLLCQQ